MEPRGIILAAGSGTRLHPATLAISKQLLPVYDKPMIFYPLTLLMEAGIRQILLITTALDRPRFESILGDGSQWGISLQYEVQPSPIGLADAFVVGEPFCSGTHRVCMVLGDNLFHGAGLSAQLKQALEAEKAHIFLSQVQDPSRYGVAIFKGDRDELFDIIEKPRNMVGHAWAVTGLYVYPSPQVSFLARQLQPSERGELEITDLNRTFLATNQLVHLRLARGTVWMDTGTFPALHQAAAYVQAIQERQGWPVGCPDVAARDNGWVDVLQRQQNGLRYGQAYADLL